MDLGSLLQSILIRFSFPELLLFAGGAALLGLASYDSETESRDGAAAAEKLPLANDTQPDNAQNATPQGQECKPKPAAPTGAAASSSSTPALDNDGPPAGDRTGHPLSQQALSQRPGRASGGFQRQRPQRCPIFAPFLRTRRTMWGPLYKDLKVVEAWQAFALLCKAWLETSEHEMFYSAGYHKP